MADWQDVTSNSYWTPETALGTTWDGTEWDNVGAVLGLFPGTWATGYSPTKLRFQCASVPDLWILNVTATGSGQFEIGVLPNTEITLTHTGDITKIQIISNEAIFSVTKLELYGDPIVEEASEVINMARFIYQGVMRDGAGNVISGATISVFLAGTTTAASVYATSTGGVAVNSVATSTSGKYSFHVDNDDYAADQRFKIISSKTGYQSDTWDNLVIFPYIRTVSA